MHIYKKVLIIVTCFTFFHLSLTWAQGEAAKIENIESIENKESKRDKQIQNFRKPDKRGINTFESPKDKPGKFQELEVQVGVASALQYQAITHKNETDGSVPANVLAPIGQNFNLATANFDINAQLAEGVRMHLRTYFSSRHHPEPYVKGGYLQIDRLHFIKKGFLDPLMNKVTIKVGHMENNYGDAHFRRSDNARVMYNPFVGNLLMDSFNTEVGGEVYFRHKGFLVMLGSTNGKLNQNVTTPDQTEPAFLGKVGYDSFLTSDLRVRLTASGYTLGKAQTIYMYRGDRTGARYYSVLRSNTATSDDFRSGRFDPGFKNNLQAIMINPFVKFMGLEFFGTFEVARGDEASQSAKRTMIHWATELIYRFSIGHEENLFVGVRYNQVTGKQSATDSSKVTVDRVQVGMGWFLTKNIMVKGEYVQQRFRDFPSTSIYHNGKFDGFMFESAISF